MNVPAHLILGLAVFGREGDRQSTWGALAGSLVPDVSLFVMVGVQLYVVGTPPAQVFGGMYFSESWQNVFRVDNSFILWGVALAVAALLRSRWAMVFCAAALLHLVFDFSLHNDDARQNFWPLTSWVFNSPLSYWDPRHYGNVVGPIEIGVTVVLAGLLLRRYRAWKMRGLIVLLALAEAVPGIIFNMMFAAGLHG